MFLQRTGIKIPHIPYKGAGPALTALLGQQYTFFIDKSSFEKPG
jgi:tripartite-type tricarboxylate transporter receptor subunit TctC